VHVCLCLYVCAFLYEQLCQGCYLYMFCLFVFFVIYIHVLYIRDFAQSFVYLSMFDLKNKIETYFVQYVCQLIRALFSALFFFLSSFSFICIVLLVILFWQEFINRKLQIISRFIVLFLFLFSRSMPSRQSTTVTTTQVSKKVCDRRAFKVLRYHYY